MIYHHIILIFISVIFFEVFNRINLFTVISLNLKIFKKGFKLTQKKRISIIHKETAFNLYSKKIFNNSLYLALILLLICCFFLIINFFIKDFLKIFLTLTGILEVIISIFLYYHLRKFILNE